MNLMGEILWSSLIHNAAHYEVTDLMLLLLDHFDIETRSFFDSAWVHGIIEVVDIIIDLQENNIRAICIFAPINSIENG